MSTHKPKIGDYKIVREKALMGASHRWYVYKLKRTILFFPMWHSVNLIGFPSEDAATAWVMEKRRPAAARYL